MTSSSKVSADLAAKRAVWMYAAGAILAMLWLPLVLIINPGWLTLILFSPFVLIAIMPPLLVFLTIQGLRRRAIGAPYVGMIWTFFVSWLVAGLCFINFGDTEDSVQSLMTRMLQGAASRDTLVAISTLLCYSAAILAIGLSVILFILMLIHRSKLRRSSA